MVRNKKARELDENWEIVEKRVKGAIEEIEKNGAKKKRVEDGEMRSARQKKVRRELRDCLRWERKAEEVRKKGKVWEIMNRERRMRKRINEGIG